MSQSRYYVSTASATTLPSGCGASDTTLTIAAMPGTWPAQYPYGLLADWGLSTQEVMLVTGAPTGGGPFVIPVTRGADGTTAQSHATGAEVVHGVSGEDFNQWSAFIDSLTGTAASSFTQRSNNLSDLASAGTARTNLGLGTAATQASSAFDAAGAASAAVATETTRAEAAEALLAPLASPGLTGTPTAPTKTALTSSTALATTAYADAAVGAETTRAQAAEAAKTNLLTKTAVKTTTYTAAAGDYVACDSTSGTFTVTLPNAPAVATVVGVKLVTSAASVNAVTVACAGSDVLNKSGGSTTYTLSLLSQGATFQYGSGGIWLVQNDDLPLGQMDARYANVFSPLAFGAAGNGTTDDTTALQNCAAAAAAAKGVMDLGTRTFKTTSAITVSNDLHVCGSGLNGGVITNGASDLFSVSGTVTSVNFISCSLFASAGHVFNCASGANTGFWNILNCNLGQAGGSFSIWYMPSGNYIDMLVGDNCFMTCAATASVSPWYIVSTGGSACNSNTWRRMRMTANHAQVPWFHIENQSGVSVDNQFSGITGEVCDGGLIQLRSCLGATMENFCAYDTTVFTGHLYDIGTHVGAGQSGNITIRNSGRRGGALGSPAWAATTSYAAGVYVHPTVWNGHVYKCTVAGTSGGSEPTWITTGPPNTQTDGGVTWEDLGSGFAQTVYDVNTDGNVTALILENAGPQSGSASYNLPARTGGAEATTTILGQSGAVVPGVVSTMNEVAISSATTLVTSDLGKMHACALSSAGYTFTLPAPTFFTGQQIGVRVTPASTKLLTLATAAGNIDGASTRIMWAGESAILESDGTNWVKIAGKTLPMQGVMVGTSTSTATGTVTNVPLGATYIDNTGLMCDPTTGKTITVQRPATYSVLGRIEWNTMPAASNRTITVCYKNGSGSTVVAQDERTAGNASSPCISAVGTVTFAASDTCTLNAFQNSGSSVSTVGGSTPFGAGTIMSLTEIPAW